MPRACHRKYSDFFHQRPFPRRSELTRQSAQGPSIKEARRGLRKNVVVAREPGTPPPMDQQAAYQTHAINALTHATRSNTKGRPAAQIARDELKMSRMSHGG